MASRPAQRLRFVVRPSLCLEEQLEGELDVAPLVWKRAVERSCAGRTVDGVDRRDSSAVLDIEVGRLDIHVVMVENVVEFAAELHGEPLRQLEVLHSNEINVPEAWRLIAVAPWEALTILGVHATHSVQSTANRHCESVSVTRGQAIRIQRKREVRKQVRRPRNWIASIGMSRSRNRGSRHVTWARKSDGTQVGAIINRERIAGVYLKDRRHAPASKCLPGESIARVLHPRQVPHAADHEALTRVVVRVTLV